MKKWVFTIGLIVIGLLFLTIGIYVGETDDSPGAGGLGIILMICFFVLAWRVFRKYNKR